MSKKVFCIAEFKTLPQNEDALFNALMQLEPITMREDGCIHYTVTRPIQCGFAKGMTEFNIVLHEKFKSEEDFNWHNSQPYILDFFNKYVASTETKLVEGARVRLFSDNI